MEVLQRARTLVGLRFIRKNNHYELTHCGAPFRNTPYLLACTSARGAALIHIKVEAISAPPPCFETKRNRFVLLFAPDLSVVRLFWTVERLS
jgi:hypothetical protein